MAALPATVDDPTLDSLIPEALDETSNDIDLATAQVIRWLDSYPRLRHDIIRREVRRRVATIRTMRSKPPRTRARLPHAARPVIVAPPSDGLRSLAAANLQSLLDMEMPIGKRLIECRRADCHESARQFDNTSRMATVYAKWLREIAIDLHGNLRVGDVFSDERLTELLERTKRARR